MTSAGYFSDNRARATARRHLCHRVIAQKGRDRFQKTVVLNSEMLMTYKPLCCDNTKQCVKLVMRITISRGVACVRTHVSGPRTDP
jgi:hypothetical protein